MLMSVCVGGMSYQNTSSPWSLSACADGRARFVHTKFVESSGAVAEGAAPLGDSRAPSAAMSSCEVVG